MNLSEAAQKIKAEADQYFLKFGQLKHQEEQLAAEMATVRLKLAELQAAFSAEMAKPSTPPVAEEKSIG